MAALPTVTGREAIKAFEAFGFREARQASSHVIMKKAGYPILLSVPLHDPVKPGTLRRLIRDAGLTVEEFCREA